MPALAFEDTFPNLAAELRAGLLAVQEERLADQVRRLTVLDRCRCGDEFCATMYARLPPRNGWGPGLRNVDVPLASGMLILDVVDEEIASIELLFRDDVRSQLLTLLP
jgi:hypothetical protein